jgi:Tfp pilus assembly protein PilF
LAQSSFERSLELEPDNWPALKGLERIHNKLGQFALEKEYMNRA